MGGKLAKAYAGLMHDMYRGKQAATAPWELKKTLGSKINRFAGYNQQDSSELVNYLLDLIHEDLNRVTEKPYVERRDDEGREDQIVALEYWENFIARNQSIIVDLMYGQLKSTVTCLTCGNTAKAFDPYLSIQLPLEKPEAREQKRNFYFVASEMFDYEEEMEIYDRKTLPIIEITITNKTTIRDIKRQLNNLLKIDSLKEDELLVCAMKKSKVDKRLKDV